MKTLQTDLLVIGTGISGCSAAMAAAEAGTSVIVATRAADPRESNTVYAQGGIIYKGEDDSENLFTEDFQRAGNGFCNPSALHQLWEEGPKLVKEILMDRLGIRFSSNGNGNPHLTREAAHSVSRILHVADYTGKAIEEAFIQALRVHPRVTILPS